MAGCDVVSQQSNSKEKKVAYKVTNDLDSRLTVASQNSSASGANTANTAAPAKLTSFTIQAQVTPPNVASGTERASFVEFNSDDNKLYAGYMIRGDGPGNGFGGGIDIIDVASPTSPDADPSGSNVNALQVDGVDVQESAVGAGNANDAVLFLGVAEEESFDIGNTPSEVHSINLDPNNGTPVSSGGTVEFEDRDLPGDLVKGVSEAASGDSDEFYAVTDANTFHQFDVTGTGSIDDVTTDETSSSPGIEFRGLAANPDGGWVMDDAGDIWQAPTGGGLNQRATFSTPNFFGSDLLSIARVTSPDDLTCPTGGGGDPVVITALNNGGFRILKTGSSSATEIFRNSSLEVTSVTATSDFVYVASGNTIALYSVESTICNTTTNEGLSKIGKAEISSFDNAASFTFNGGQVNEIVVDNSGSSTYLYIAKGQDGVFVVEQEANGYP